MTPKNTRLRQGQLLTGRVRIENRSSERIQLSHCYPPGGLWQDGAYKGGQEPRGCPAIVQYLAAGEVIDTDYSIDTFAYTQAERRPLPPGRYWFTLGLGVVRDNGDGGQTELWVDEAVVTEVLP